MFFAKEIAKPQKTKFRGPEQKSQNRYFADPTMPDNTVAQWALNLTLFENLVADHLGLTIETVSRAFTRLAKDKIIELDTPSSISLIDRDRLIECAENYQV